jgi:Flp pilus assembly protein TadD
MRRLSNSFPLISFVVQLAILLATSLATTATGQSIESHTTVRHHREAVEEQPAEIAQAEEAIQKGNFPAAEALVKKAVARDPDNKEKWAYQAWFDLGFVLNRLGRSDESIVAYRKSVAAKPDVFESNLNLGLMLERTRDPEAEKYLRAATTLIPTSHVEEGQARAWLSLGHAIENRDPAQALVAYGKAAELTPADPEPHLSAGLLDERQKDFPAAETQYKKVLEIDVRSTEAAIGLTNIYMKAGRLADAEPLLRRLTADRPDDGGLHLQLGRVLAAEKKNDDAITEFEAALKLSPKDLEAQQELADLYAGAGKNDLAETAYRPLVAAHPNDPELHRSLGRALLLQKKFPDAQQELLAAVRLKRDSPDAYVDLAFAASENKNYDLAVRAMNGRASLNADMPPICFFMRASAYDHLGDWKQASADYHSFLDAANGKYPDQEWQARHRLVTIEHHKR